MDAANNPSPLHFAGREALWQFISEQQPKLARGATLFVIECVRYTELITALSPDEFGQLQASILTQLESMTDDNGEVFRVDSSLFGILWYRTLNKGQCVLACTRILREMYDTPFCRDSMLQIDPKIGVAGFDSAHQDVREWVNAAFLALGRTHEIYAKYAIFAPQMRESVHRAWQLRHALTRAVEQQEFGLVYQPRVDLQTGQCLGVEALLRWDSPELGEISPDEFVPVMEDVGLITEATDWVFRRGARELDAWLSEDECREFAFNISTQVLMDPEFSAAIKHNIGLWTMNPRQIVLEITETSIWGDRETSIPALEELRSMGIKVAIDDFGTGYSTLEYLRDLDVDQIKIDKSFVMRMLNSRRDRFIVELIIGIAREFDLEVVAEGAESPEILRILKSIGCTTAQGFGISRPMPYSELIQWSKKLRGQPLQF